MKIIFLNTLLYYAIIAIIFEAIYFKIGYDKLNKNQDKKQSFIFAFDIVKKYLLIFFYHIYIVYAIIFFTFLIILPLIFPFLVISLVKKMIGYNNPKQQEGEEKIEEIKSDEERDTDIIKPDDI